MDYFRISADIRGDPNLDQLWSGGAQPDYCLYGQSFAPKSERGGLKRIKNMPKVSLDLPAPDFSLLDFKNKPVSLSDFKEKSNVLLVFNRGFA